MLTDQEAWELMRDFRQVLCEMLVSFQKAHPQFDTSEALCAMSSILVVMAMTVGKPREGFIAALDEFWKAMEAKSG